VLVSCPSDAQYTDIEKYCFNLTVQWPFIAIFTGNALLLKVIVGPCPRDSLVNSKNDVHAGACPWGLGMYLGVSDLYLMIYGFSVFMSCRNR